MSQSYTKVFVHITFRTKYNYPYLKPEIRDELNAYIGGILNNYSSIPLQVGCVFDHVHILCTLPKTLSLSNLVEQVKKSTSKWIKQKGKEYHLFYWMPGYGAFSVSSSGVEATKRYIQNQEEHHKKSSSRNELKKLLREYNISYDEKYL